MLRVAGVNLRGFQCNKLDRKSSTGEIMRGLPSHIHLHCLLFRACRKMHGRETDGFDLVELEWLHEVHLSVLVEPHGYGVLAMDAGGFVLGIRCSRWRRPAATRRPPPLRCGSAPLFLENEDELVLSIPLDHRGVRPQCPIPRSACRREHLVITRFTRAVGLRVRTTIGDASMPRLSVCPRLSDGWSALKANSGGSPL